MMLDSDDWKHALRFGAHAKHAATAESHPFAAGDIDDVVASSDGPKGHGWSVVGRLKDGRWFFLSVGHNGNWSSGAVNVARVADSFAELEISLPFRELLGLTR